MRRQKRGFPACFLPWDAWGTPGLVSFEFAEDLLGVSDDVYSDTQTLMNGLLNI